LYFISILFEAGKALDGCRQSLAERRVMQLKPCRNRQFLLCDAARNGTPMHGRTGARTAIDAASTCCSHRCCSRAAGVLTARTAIDGASDSGLLQAGKPMMDEVGRATHSFNGAEPAQRVTAADGYLFADRQATTHRAEHARVQASECPPPAPASFPGQKCPERLINAGVSTLDAGMRAALLPHPETLPRGK
jgi:hypothetical protein